MLSSFVVALMYYCLGDIVCGCISEHATFQMQFEVVCFAD